ncbi:hypothetical protein [Haladaptatus sp. DJG-WS-42]|uniref:hypothetical protein n=1 Tax=Haladaptatus sp. DJG-WS-42 TaxID=3120516 RepID=UPI0030D5823B
MQIAHVSTDDTDQLSSSSLSAPIMNHSLASNGKSHGLAIEHEPPGGGVDG